MGKSSYLKVLDSNSRSKVKGKYNQSYLVMDSNSRSKEKDKYNQSLELGSNNHLELGKHSCRYLVWDKHTLSQELDRRRKEWYSLNPGLGKDKLEELDILLSHW
jgi:hypothetical protein